MIGAYFHDVSSPAGALSPSVLKEFTDSAVGTDTFDIPQREKSFSDSAVGTDTFDIPQREKGFSDSAVGSEVFGKFRVLKKSLLRDVYLATLVDIYDEEMPDLSSGLVGYWGFSESGTTAKDYSGNGYDGTMYSGSTPTDLHDVSGKVGIGAKFDGVDDYVDVPYNFGRPNTITIALWFKTTSASWDALFGQASVQPPTTATFYIPVFAIKDTGILRAELWTGAIGEISTSFSVRDGNWHHAVIVGNINTQSLYVDGSLIGSRTGTIDQSWWNYSTIGTGSGSTTRGFPSTAWHYFNGSIDEVRIYNRALSEDEIRLLYEATR